jgi:GDPmannose 4,6-dehydratase
MKKKALISGITGMDGSLLSELLLRKGYEVHGIVRRASVFNTERIDHLMSDESVYNKNLFCHYGDLTDSSNLSGLVSEIKPDEIYNLGAQSHVKVSFEVPEYTADVDGTGVLRLLDAIVKHCPTSKFYQASTSEMFGGIKHDMPSCGYNEESKFHPRSPYGAAKLYGYWITRNYREAYNLFCSNGILFNHEHYRRGSTFVTKKITEWCAKFEKNLHKGPLKLGNLYACRDWGHAEDYVDAMYLIMQHDTPDDWVVSTGETHSVKQFITECFKYLNKDLIWHGSGIDEIAICNGENVVEIDSKYFRPSEVDVLLGDSTKIKAILGWKPKYSFIDLVKNMMQEELDRT